MRSVAVRRPFAFGLARTPMVQDAPGASCLPEHVSETTLKSPGFAPARLTLEMPSVAPPVLCTVTVCVALVVLTRKVPNERLDGVTDAAGAGAPAVAFTCSATCCGLFGALSVITSVAQRLPTAVGVDESVISQKPYCGIGAEVHVVLSILKSPGLVPASASESNVSGASPSFWMSISCVGVVVPTGVVPNQSPLPVTISASAPALDGSSQVTVSVGCGFPSLA